MKILVTGATGFIGNHVLRCLLENAKDCDIIATSANPEKAGTFDWFDKVNYIACDFHKEKVNFFEKFNRPEMVIHLAWSGLPNYSAPFHIEENLPANLSFLKSFIENGVKKIAVAGTCYEYGLQEGCLAEDAPSNPVTMYGLAKDTLRRSLELLIGNSSVRFNWIRIFYLYGPGQNSRALIPLLEHAVQRGEKVFNMSGGAQLRDYLPVEQAAGYICKIALQDKIRGIVNCCSGNPVSIKNLVESRIKELNAGIALNLGYYPYPEYEPMAFWGNSDKIKKIIMP
ncbi:MAG: NAD(P)-dependent oxidoreductase [Victivallaceae bacterium]|jgi:dTDP-6-deoxy-L-talose 4-dehydrogenase (NAD+)